MRCRGEKQNVVGCIPHNGRDRTSSVQFFDFATGKAAEIVKVTKPLDLGLGVSPDVKTLIMLVENFH